MQSATRQLALSAARQGARQQSTAAAPPSWVGLRINGKKILAHPKASVLQACEEAQIDVPRFCYHEHLSVAGNCRMCVVEVQKTMKPVVSCAMPVSSGMNVWTDTPMVKKAREGVLEFLLQNHPLDCPICDQGGECDLQDLTMAYGSDRGRFRETKRSVEDKEVGPIVKTVMTRCIHCTRCVRFAAEVAGTETLGAFGRGNDMEIGTYVSNFVKSELSGNLVDLCPVGALTSKPYAMSARPWELQRMDSVDFLDGLATDILIETRLETAPNRAPGAPTPPGTSPAAGERILRILPRKGLYPEPWITDRTRYAFDALKSRYPVPYRVDAVNGNGPTHWLDALYDIAFRLERNLLQRAQPETMPWHGGEGSLASELLPHRVGAVLGPTTDLESAYALATLVKLMGGSEVQVGDKPAAINVDAPFFYSLNRLLGAPAPEDLPREPGGALAGDLELGFPSFAPKLSTMLLIGANTRHEAALLHVLLRKQLGRAPLQGVSPNRQVPPLAAVGAFANLALPHAHLGSGARALLALAENRSSVGTAYYRQSGAAILLSSEATKGAGGALVQNVTRFLGRKFGAKTRRGERLGMLHGGVGSLAGAHLGIAPGVRSPLRRRGGGGAAGPLDAGISTLFALQLGRLSSAKWVSASATAPSVAAGHPSPALAAPAAAPAAAYTKTYAMATHKDLDYRIDGFLPVRVPYESDGHVVNAEGRVRRFRTSVTPHPDARSPDVFVFALARMVTDWFGALDALWSKGLEVPVDGTLGEGTGTTLERAPLPFHFNPWGVVEDAGGRAPAFAFHPPVPSFYQADLLSARSPTMAECALFLERDSNFHATE